MKHVGNWLLVTFMCCTCSLSAEPAAEEPTPEQKIRARNLATVVTRQKANERKAKGQSHLMVRRGLLADKTAKTIAIAVEATGLPERSTAEFFLISDTSGHDYEALFVSLAKPGDIIQALEFIGMKRGRPARHDRLQFWPKGERVFLTVHADNRTIPMEHCITNSLTQSLLLKSGFVFTGSLLKKGATPPAYLADTQEPGSIASNYNEPESVLDLPQNAPQKSVYRQQSVSRQGVFPAGTLLQVTLEPEHKDGARRVKDMILAVTPTRKKDLQFLVTTPDGKRLTEDGKLNTALEFFTSEVRAGRDPYVAVQFDPALPIGRIRPVCELLGPIDSTKGIRVEPPASGHVFYKGFMPNDGFRIRSQRMAQPWELYLERTEGTLHARLIRISESWAADADKPTLTQHPHVLATPNDLATIIAEDAEAAKEDHDRHPVLPVVLVFAPKDLPYRDIMQYIAVLPETHNTIYVFAE